MGTSYGRYQVTRRIAVGGMGEVYAATHELMGSEAVIKVLLPEMSVKTDIVKRFFQEAQAAAAIQHPGIVRIFDMGYADDDRAFIVMEKLQGETLRDRLKAEGHLDADTTSALMIQLARAVGAAHDHGIVHRDLKPANIFVSPDADIPGGERIKVLDFGLAKLAGNSGSLVTHTGAVFGTPAYMAPEQCTDAGNVDYRADLYAIGCIMYACLCGRPPFGRGGIQLIAAHLRDTPRSPQVVDPSVPHHLDAIVMRLLQKQPEHRFADCRQLVAALERRGEPIAAKTEKGWVGAVTDPSDQETIRQRRLSGPPVVATEYPSPAMIGPPPTARRPPSIGDPIETIDPPPRPASSPQRARSRGVAAKGSGPRPATEGEASVFNDGKRYGINVTHPSSSPTVDNATNVIQIDGAPPRRKGLAIVGGLAVAASLLAGVAVAMLLSEDGPDVADMATAAEVQTPPQPAQEPATEAEVPSENPLEQARQALAEERWDDAIAYSERTLEIDPGNRNAATLLATATSEKEAREGLGALRRAVESEDYAAAASALAAIADTSAYKQPARERYDEAGEAYVERALAQAKKLMKSKSCSDIAALRDESAALWPEKVAPLSALQAQCQKEANAQAAARETSKGSSGKGKGSSGKSKSSKGKSKSKASYDDLIEQTRSAFFKSQYGVALRACKQAYKAKATSDAVKLCGMAACKTKQERDAKRFYARAGASAKSIILQECLREDIDLR